MQLEDYHYLLEINRCRSISGAARALGLRQPTLSAIVSATEQEVGFPIFYHSQSGMLPTAKGEKLLAAARDINIKAETLYALTNQTGANTQPIRIPMSRGASVGAAVSLARRYYDFDLYSNLIFEEYPRKEIPSLLMQHTANVALALFPTSDIAYYLPRLAQNNISMEIMYSCRFYLLCSKEHPLAAREEPTDNVFQTESFCVITGVETFGVGSIYSDLIRKCRYLVSVTNYALAKELILQQNMLSIHNWYTLCTGHIYEPDKMAAIPIPRDFAPDDLHLCLLHRSSRHLRYQERILVSCLEQYFQELKLPDPPAADPVGDARFWGRAP